MIWDIQNQYLIKDFSVKLRTVKYLRITTNYIYNVYRTKKEDILIFVFCKDQNTL